MRRPSGRGCRIVAAGGSPSGIVAAGGCPSGIWAGELDIGAPPALS